MEHLYADVGIVGTDTLYDLDAVKQSIITLMKTHKGERLFRPKFGTELENYLWQPISDSVASDIKGEIMRAVGMDYRANINGLEVEPDNVNNCYNVKLNIVVKGVESSIDMILKKKGL